MIKEFVAAVDRRPVAAWAGVGAGVALAVAVPGDVLGGMPAYLVGPESVFWFLAVPVALLMLAASAMAGYAIVGLPTRWFGWGRWRSRTVALLLVLAGLAPWLVPNGPSLGRAGQAPGWAAACCGAALLALATVALLLLPRRRVQVAAAVGLLLLAGFWGWARHAWLDGEANASYLALGSPPRSLLRLVDWDWAAPGVVSYQDGRVSVEYDVITPIPSPDGNQVAALVTERLPGGSGADFLCGEGQKVSVLTATAAGFDPDTSTSCAALSGGVLRIGHGTLVRQDGDVLVFLVMDEDMDAEGDLSAMVQVLDSEHVAANSEIRDLTPPQD